MPAVAIAIVGIALPDSLNPSLIVAAVYLALGSHPVRRTLTFTTAAFAVTLAGGIAVALGLGEVFLSLLPKFSSSVKYALMTAVGVALVLGGAVLWMRRSSLAASKPPSERQGRDRGDSAALLGAGIAGVEFFTAFPYFAAIAMVVGSSVSQGAKLFLLVLYNVIYVLPLIAIVVASAVLGERGGQLIAPIGDWIATRWPMVVAPLAAAAGIALAAYGIVQLN